MKITTAGKNLVKEFEGCYLKAYKCPAGIWTIGWGHTSDAGPPLVVEGMVISRSEASTILDNDLSAVSYDVNSVVKVPLTPNQSDALISFVFNIGIGAFTKSTLLKRLNSGNYDSVPEQLMRWTKGGGRELPGLVRRRQAESTLWRKINEEAAIEQDARSEPDAPAPVKTMAQSKEGNAAIAVGGASAIAMATQVIPVVQQGMDVIPAMRMAFGQVGAIAITVAILASIAIWYWRRKRLIEDGK